MLRETHLSGFQKFFPSFCVGRKCRQTLQYASSRSLHYKLVLADSLHAVMPFFMSWPHKKVSPKIFIVFVFGNKRQEPTVSAFYHTVIKLSNYSQVCSFISVRNESPDTLKKWE